MVIGYVSIVHSHGACYTWSTMSKSIKKLLCEVKAELESIYGSHLKGVYLYGSYARNEADSESDVDVLVVLDRIGRYTEEIERTGHLIADLSLKHNVSLSRVFIRERDWLHAAMPFLINVREEAIAAS